MTGVTSVRYTAAGTSNENYVQRVQAFYQRPLQEVPARIVKVDVLGLVPFPNCCGIQVFTRFNDDAEDIEAELKRRTQTMSTGLSLIALNMEQVPDYEAAVLAAGFEVLLKFHHDWHGNDITLYGKRKHQSTVS